MGGMGGADARGRCRVDVRNCACARHVRRAPVRAEGREGRMLVDRVAGDHAGVAVDGRVRKRGRGRGQVHLVRRGESLIFVADVWNSEGFPFVVFRFN